MGIWEARRVLGLVLLFFGSLLFQLGGGSNQLETWNHAARPNIHLFPVLPALPKRKCHRFC